MSFSFKKYGLCFLIGFCIYCTENIGQAQNKDTILLEEFNKILLQADSLLKSLSVNDYDLIHNITGSFYENFKDDERFSEILENIKLNVEAYDLFNLDKSIEKATVDEYNNYNITQELLTNINDKSIIAAKILASYYLDVKPAKFSYSSLKSQRVSMNSTVFAWLIAHEIAHQYLNHTQPDNVCYQPQSLEISRDCEIEADNLAFGILVNSDYSIVKLLAFFNLMKKIEEWKYILNKIPEEEMCSHPYWNTRFTNLYNFFLYRNPREPRLYAYSTFWPGEKPEGPTRFSFWLLNDPGNHFGVITTNDVPELVAYDLSEEPKINIYQRTNEGILHFTVEDKSSHETNLFVDGTGIFASLDGTLKAFRDDMISVAVLSQSNKYDGVFNAALNWDRQKLFKVALMEITRDPDEIEYGLKIMDENQTQNGLLFYHYHNGTIDLNEYTAKSETGNNDYLNKLRTIFNDTQINKLTMALVGDYLPYIEQFISNQKKAVSELQVCHQPTAVCVREIMSGFLDPETDKNKLMEQIKPTPDDYRQLYKEPFATSLISAQAEFWKPGEVIYADPGQTEINVILAKTDDLINRTPVSDYFAGGHEQLIQYMKPGFHVARFAFVRPGNKYGMSYDVFFFIGDRWVFVPKPWRALNN